MCVLNPNSIEPIDFDTFHLKPQAIGARGNIKRSPSGNHECQILCLSI